MKSSAMMIDEPSAASSASVFGPMLIWLFPLLYPVWYSTMAHSVQSMRTGAMAGKLYVATALAWALCGPFAAWLTLDYLDRNELKRGQCRFAVNGALLAAGTPPLFIFMGVFLAQFHRVPLKVPVWYLINLVVGSAALVPASEAAVAAPAFRRIHGISAMLIVLFAIFHVSNNVLAIVSLNTHATILHALRLVYRKRLIEIALVAAVITQALTGLTMVWKSRLRRTTTFRNLQTVSGLYMASFFLSHLFATLSARWRGIDTTFAWATNAPSGLLVNAIPVALLPYYALAVVMLFVHLACQARRNLARVMSDTASRQISYSLIALGALVAFVIALAACAVHLRS